MKRQERTKAHKPASAFITTRKRFCYLTIRCGRTNLHIMRIRAYALPPDDKRHMRRLYPDVLFDWKKITQQLVEKREICREYRSRRKLSRSDRAEPGGAYLFALFDPTTRAVYVDDLPSTAAAAGALLDAVLHLDRTAKQRRS